MIVQESLPSHKMRDRFCRASLWRVASPLRGNKHHLNSKKDTLSFVGFLGKHGACVSIYFDNDQQDIRTTRNTTIFVHVQLRLR